ncbi:MAG: hypothetical protein KGM47_08520, partial [Acidobacteriota bacterium]|nr:hypothetical protein [Acidobacteriota bacterium]
MDRRQFNLLIAGGALLSPLGRAHGRFAVQPARTGPDGRELYEWWQKGCSGTEPVFTPGLSQADDEFLEDVERRAFRYFWEQADSTTGLVADRARSSGEAIAGRNLHLASIAATGFGLSALAVAAERKWIP